MELPNELPKDRKIKVKLYIDLENMQNAWSFIRHLKDKQKAIIITSTTANIPFEVPINAIHKIDPTKMKAIIVNRNQYKSDGVCDVRLLSELMDNINKADVHIIISKDNGYKAFTDFNKKCNKDDKAIYQVSTEQELESILKAVNVYNHNIKTENKAINPMTIDVHQAVEPLL